MSTVYYSEPNQGTLTVTMPDGSVRVFKLRNVTIEEWTEEEEIEIMSADGTIMASVASHTHTSIDLRASVDGSVVVKSQPQDSEST